jgi:hypothetical protein
MNGYKLTHKIIYRFRSSVTGRWITPAMAQRNPDTSEREEYETSELTALTAAQKEMSLVLDGMAQSETEDVAEWVLYGQSVLNDFRAVVLDCG